MSGGSQSPFFSPSSRIPLRDGLFLAALLAITAAIYWTGLYGPFILDDTYNLISLDGLPADPTWRDLLAFVASGVSSQTGRPISLLTFALQHDDWPGNPFGFKVVNLGIHLLVGAVLYLMLLRLSRLMGLARERAGAIALWATALWLLHPLQVSTVLYIVQRMAQLSTLLVLVGLLVYLFGRQRALEQERLRSGYLWMSLGVGGGSVLAFLAKENGALLPLFVIVLEATLLARLPRPGYWRAWQGVFLWLPVALLAAYFAAIFETGILAGYGARDFSLSERLMTEARVLADYMRKIALPWWGDYGLFHDDFRISRSLFEFATAGAVLLVVALIGTAIWLRRAAPLFSFAVLWFFVGHVLESSFIPLELYFEHRNYLPLVGPLLAVVHGAAWGVRRMTPTIRPIAPPILAVLLVGVLFITHEQTHYWGHPFVQAELYAWKQPYSFRAQTLYATAFSVVEEYERAAEVYATMAERFPESVGAHLMWLIMGCTDGRFSLPESEAVLPRAATAKYELGAVAVLNDIVGGWDEGRCPRVGRELVHGVIDALLANPRYAPTYYNLYILKGRLKAQEGDYQAAVESYGKSYSLRPAPSPALTMMRWSAVELGDLRAALNYLQRAEEAYAAKPVAYLMNKDRLEHWRTTLEEAMRRGTAVEVVRAGKVNE